MINFNSLSVLKRALESSTTGIVIVDNNTPGMPLTYVNKAFETLTGYSREFSVGKNCKFLQGPETDEKQVDKIRTAIKKAESCKVILLNYKKDGTKFWNELSISPIKEEGILMGFIGIQDDITARVEMEKKLLEAKQKAEKANKSKADFLNVISHELRTPLTVMLGNLPLLTDPDDMPETEEIVEIATDIEEAGTHLLGLINELLDLSKIEEGRLELNIEPLHIRDCIKESLSLVKSLIVRKKLDLIEEVEDFSFIGDAIRMKQVIINLLGNAAKFTDKGSITIVSKIEGNKAHLIIRDTGCGIKEEYKSQIFDVFKQVDSSVIRANSGSGLGLAISKKLIEMHNGTIDVESEYGVRSDFCITLPIL
jgi:PAS domain S-box-containing protein